MKHSSLGPTLEVNSVLRILIIIIWSLIPSIGVASSLTIDFCSFRAENNDSYVEIYIDLPRDEVTMGKDSSGWYGALIFTSQIRQNNNSVATDNWIIDFIEDREPIVSSTQRVIDARIYRLVSRFYDIVII